MGREKRTYQRVTFPAAIKYRTDEMSAAAWHDGRLHDLGAGGLRFTSLEALEPNAKLDVQFASPNREAPYSFRGRIVWVHEIQGGETEYGVAFVDMTPDQQYELDELVQFLSRGPK